ncbi:protein tyrosine phosphatase family protein [Alteromonas sp. A079]|uniref:protein tyrosine phosphatase family protein n=1 Tax=Alteromonas sp. A079 TaxID=3410268 RepID=UPI003BA1F483
MNGFVHFEAIKKVSNALLSFVVVITYTVVPWAYANTQVSAQQTKEEVVSLDSLTNYQVNNSFMHSSGLPAPEHFAFLKAEGVTHVIDLIPGDRSEEAGLTHALGLHYTNIPVDWQQPTVEHFEQYVLAMAQAKPEEEKVLTHCKLNWRGASFTYLYRITVLGEDETVAKKDLLNIWQPNVTWFTFMGKAISRYNTKHNTSVSMSFLPSVEQDQ